MRFITIAVLIAVLAEPSRLTAAPALTFEARAVSVSGIAPKGQVVWFSVAREISDHMATIVRRDDVLTDGDGDGVVRFELDREVPRQSIWVAIDLASGAATVATPAGYPLRDLTAGRPGLGQGGIGRPVWTEASRLQVQLLLVRPGVGAWGLMVGDGGQNDDSPAADGLLAARLTRMRSTLAAGPAAPDQLRPKDLIFAIDPDRMEYFSERIPDPQP